MDLDRLLQLFGSFTRKKKKSGKHDQEKRKSLQPTSLSAGNSPIHHQFRRNSQPLDSHIPPRTSAYGERPRKLKEWDCGLCRRELVEPRLLGCLHSFCTRCLQSLHQEGESEGWSEVDGDSSHLNPGRSRSGSGATSAGSGYESELRDLSGSEVSWNNGEKPSKCKIYTKKVSGKSFQYIICPTCRHETQLPIGGISALPLNYVILRKMVAAGLEDSDYDSVLCDLCSNDNRAESRCSQCLVSVCSTCGEVHSRQKTQHALHPLGIPLPPLKYCMQHPRAELCVYCATCQQVVCRDCCIASHSGHALANASRAAAERAKQLREACDRAKHVPQQAETAARFLNVQAMEVDVQASRVEAQVASWAEQYRRAVDLHSRSLCTAAARARHKYQEKFAEKNYDLESRTKQAKEAIKFAEEILEEAKEDELLSLSGPVLKRLERLCDMSSHSAVPKFELRFAPTAPVNDILVGRLITRAPDPDKCVINVQGLQDLEVDVKQEVQLELRDAEGARVWSGDGAGVAGYFRRHDSSATPEFALVSDAGDGTYILTICPRSPGAYLFAVTVNNKPIKGSPFPCSVRMSRGHTGKYHCCAFCSSNGSKDATCACGAIMNGYKGCGHGHRGHPGSKHWSCCGSTLRRGPCTPPSRTSQMYHFSL